VFLRLKAARFFPLGTFALLALTIGAVLQTVTIVIPPSRVLSVPLPVFLSLPAAIVVSFIGANEPKVLSQTAVRNLSLRLLLEQASALGIVTFAALLLANPQPQGNLIAALRDFVGLWGVAAASKMLLPSKTSWFAPFALFASSIVAGTSGQSVSWWAWPVAPFDDPAAMAAAFISAGLGTLAITAGLTKPRLGQSR
jgi:hypothetical protein